MYQFMYFDHYSFAVFQCLCKVNKAFKIYLKVAKPDFFKRGGGGGAKRGSLKIRVLKCHCCTLNVIIKGRL